MTNVLEVQDLTLPHNLVSRPLTFSIAKGEFVTLMGENGCGKTTLLKSILGYKKSYGASVLFWGQPLCDPSRVKVMERLSLVAAEKELYPPFLTVGELLAAVKSCACQWDAELEGRLLEEFRLPRAKILSELSLGEHSKLRLLKALVRRPEFLLLDELTANLSPASRIAVTETLIELISDTPITVFYVSHSTEEAMRLSTRVMHLTRDGLKEGTAYDS